MNYVPPFDLIWLCIERQQRYIIAQWGLCVYQAGPLTLLAYVVGNSLRAIANFICGKMCALKIINKKYI